MTPAPYHAHLAQGCTTRHPAKPILRVHHNSDPAGIWCHRTTTRNNPHSNHPQCRTHSEGNHRWHARPGQHQPHTQLVRKTRKPISPRGEPYTLGQRTIGSQGPRPEPYAAAESVAGRGRDWSGRGESRPSLRPGRPWSPPREPSRQLGGQRGRVARHALIARAKNPLYEPA